jgi:hypothetical protein
LGLPKPLAPGVTYKFTPQIDNRGAAHHDRRSAGEIRDRDKNQSTGSFKFSRRQAGSKKTRQQTAKKDGPPADNRPVQHNRVTRPTFPLKAKDGLNGAPRITYDSSKTSVEAYLVGALPHVWSAAE